MQTEPSRLGPVVAPRRVRRCEAEVLPRLGGILVDPELERGLLGARQPAREHARAAEQCVDLLGQLTVVVRVDDRCDLCADFGCLSA